MANQAAVKEQKGILNPEHLYFGDNGRVFCGALRCAGATAFYSGRDLSGQKALDVCAPRRLAFLGDRAKSLRCEGCGKGAR